MRGFEIKFEKRKVQRGHVELWLAQLSKKLTVKRPALHKHIVLSKLCHGVNIKASQRSGPSSKTFGELFSAALCSYFSGLMGETHAGFEQERWRGGRGYT